MEYIIIGIVALIVFLALLLIVKIDKLRNRAYALFLEAEKNVDEDKFAYVCDNLYNFVPMTFKIFVSEDTFRVIVQKIYDQIRFVAHDMLDDGALNNSYTKEELTNGKGDEENE